MRLPAMPLAVSLIALVLILLIVSRVSAQSVNPDLVGLKGVQLIVVLENESGNRLGLTRDRALKAIEDELHKAGISFLSPPEQTMEIGTLFEKLPKDYAMLYFKVATVTDEGRSSGYAVDIRFDLLDRVRLSRDNSKETIAAIYYGRRLYLSSGKGNGEEVLDRLRVMAREFTTDFRASNPQSNKR